MKERATSGSRRKELEAGAALTLVVLLVLLSVIGSLVVLAHADAAFQRVNGDYKIERAAAIADAGLSYNVEQWRRAPTFLDSAVYPATTTAQNASVLVPRPCGGGTFTVLSIERVTLGAGSGVEGRVLTIRGEYDQLRYTFRALLAPNLNSPIQGVGTSSTQRWRSTGRFTSSGADPGTVFGNSTLLVDAGAIITGSASFVGAITNNGTIDGTQTTGAAAVTFPPQDTIVNAAFANAVAQQNVAGFWQDTKSVILTAAVAAGATRPTAMERVAAVAANLGTGFSSTNQMNQDNLVIRGGNISLPAGNYAFGRLSLDGATLTIKAPSGGGVLIMPDIYVTNGSRLILDTTDGPFKIVSGNNNAYQSALANTSTAQVYDPSGNSFSNGTLAVQIGGTGGDSDRWYKSSGGTAAVKKADGNGTLDDWKIKNDSLMAVVTSNPTDVGAELFMKSDVDLVLHNGGNFISGIQASDLGTVKTGSLSSIQALGHNAMGFAAWSAGGGNPRLDINNKGNASTGGNPSLFVGLTYGGWPGKIGANGTLEGAFVGSTLDNFGTIIYDSRLAALVSSGDANSQHVVVRSRVQ